MNLLDSPCSRLDLRAFVLAAALCPVPLLGCGSDGDDTTPGSTGDPSSEGSGPTTDAPTSTTAGPGESTGDAPGESSSSGDDPTASSSSSSSDDGTTAGASCSELTYLAADCATCVQTSCCTELGACEGDDACMDCLFDPEAACDATQLATADTARSCMYDACRLECGLSDAVCTDTPAESCVVPEGFPCDPFTNEGCAATEICAFDFVFGDDPVVQCYAPEAELDATCGECVGNCPAGFICNGPSGLPASCSEMCCDDADCAAGSICDRSDYEFLFGMPGLGACRVAQEPAQGDSCADAIAIEVGATVSGDTTTASASVDSSCGDAGAREIVYAVTPDADGTLQITLDLGWGFSVDGLLHVRTDCGDVDTELGCADFPNEPHHDEVLEVEVSAGTTYYVIADGWSADTFGPFELTVAMR